MNDDLALLSWQHPHIGRIEETVCQSHLAEVSAALRVLGIGSLGTDQHDELACLRCQAHPAKEPRELLRQWFDGAA